MKFSNKIIVFIMVFLLLFIASCLIIIAKTGVEPSTLILSVFGFCGFECGIMGWIKTTKTKSNDDSDKK